MSLPIRYRPPSPRRVERVDTALALKAASGSNRRPPMYGDGWGGTYLPGAGFGPPIVNRDYAAEAGRIDLNPLVRLCLAWYADAVTEITFRVGRKLKKGARKGEYEINATHPINEIFEQPCPVFSAEETWAKVISAFLIDGNAYLVIVRDNGGQPRELWWLPNWQVEIEASGDSRRPIKHYRAHGVTGGYYDYMPEDIVHIRDIPDDRNPLVGMGRLKPFLPYILAIQSAGEYTNSAYRKGNTGIVLMPPADSRGGYTYSAVEESEMRGHLRRLQQGLARSGDTPMMFLTSYLVHEKIGLSPSEMQAETLADRPEAYILAACGLSAMILNLPSAAASQTFANKAEASRAAWEDSALPKFGRVAYAIRDQVLYRKDPDTGERVGQFGDSPGLDIWADASEVRALREDMSEKAELWVMLKDAGLCTTEYAASQLDIPEEAIPEEEEIPEFVPGDDGEMDEDEAEATNGDGNGSRSALLARLNGSAKSLDAGDWDEDEIEALAIAMKAARGGGGKRKKKSESGRSVRPECSAAMSAIGGRRGTPADFATAGRCRAARNSERRSETLRGEGRDQAARATDRFAREMSTRRERVARVKSVLEKVRAGGPAAREVAKPKPRPKPSRTPAATAEAARPSPGRASPSVVGSVSRERVAEVEGVYRAMPAPVKEAVDRAGIKLVVAGKFADHDAGLAGSSPPGWPPGMTWANSDGGYFVRTRTVMAAERYTDFTSGREVTSKRMAGVFRHELGHAVDLHSGRDKLSDAADFVAAYDRDAAAIRASGLRWLDYYLQPGSRGREEAFAEVFAAANGGGSDHPAILQKFPRVTEFVRGRGLAT